MAIYVAGLVLGNARLPHRQATAGFVEGLAWLAQIGLFVLLGLLAAPGRLLDARPYALMVGSPSRWWRAALGAGLRVAVAGAAARPGLRSLGRPARRGADRAGDDPDERRSARRLTGSSTSSSSWSSSSRWCRARRCRGSRAVRAWPSRPGTTSVDVESAPLEEMDAALPLTVRPGSRLAGVHVIDLRLPADAALTLVHRSGEDLRADSPHLVADRGPPPAGRQRPRARGHRGAATCAPSRRAAGWPCGATMRVPRRIASASPRHPGWEWPRGAQRCVMWTSRRETVRGIAAPPHDGRPGMRRTPTRTPVTLPDARPGPAPPATGRLGHVDDPRAATRPSPGDHRPRTPAPGEPGRPAVVVHPPRRRHGVRRRADCALPRLAPARPRPAGALVPRRPGVPTRGRAFASSRRSAARPRTSSTSSSGWSGSTAPASAWCSVAVESGCSSLEHTWSPGVEGAHYVSIMEIGGGAPVDDVAEQLT